MRVSLLALVLAALHLSACGRVGYELLEQQDGVLGMPDGDAGQLDGAAPADDDGAGEIDDGQLDDAADDGASDNGADADGLADDGSVPSEPGDAGLLDASVDASTSSEGADAGAPGEPNPSLAECPVPVAPGAPLPLNRYEFARTDTLAADNIGQRNGSLTGATQEGGRVELAGSAGSYVQLPAGLVSSLSATTIMLWVRWDSGPQNQTLLDFGQSASNRLQLLASAPGQGVTLRFSTATSSFSIFTYKVLTIGTTHQLVIELDPARSYAALYLDGALEADTTGAYALSGLRDDNVWLGRSNGSEQPFNGAYDEVRIYGNALGPCAIASAARAGLARTEFARCADPESACSFAPTTSGDFWLCDELLDFATASQRCALAGMQLARVETMAKNEALHRSRTGEIYWLGLNDRRLERTFSWCDGSLPQFTSWAAGEPNDNGSFEDCVSLTGASAEWNDLRCNELHKFVCEP